MKRFQWVVWVGLIAGQAYAGVEWWEFKSPYSYKDLEVSCTEHLPSSLERVYLAAEVENGQVKQANFRESTRPGAKGHPLSAAELASLKIHSDYFGKYWVEHLQLDDASVLWIINRFGSYFCRPPQPLVAVKSKGLELDFDMTKLGTEYLVTLSDAFELHGFRKDGEPFQLEFQFEQRRH